MPKVDHEPPTKICFFCRERVLPTPTSQLPKCKRNFFQDQSIILSKVGAAINWADDCSAYDPVYEF